MTDIANKNTVITGAASGIGRLMALYFAEEKSNIAILDVNEEKLKETKREIETYGVTVNAYKCDVSKKKDIDHVTASLKKDFGQIHILINNAGIAPGSWVGEIEYKQIKETLGINLVGLMWMTRQFLPEMMERNEGHIVNISSAMGLQGCPRMCDYVASKFGVVGYSDTLRIEMKKKKLNGINVTVVCPSGIDTGMFEGYKSPLLSPLLKPENVARSVVKGVKKNKSYLKMPVRSSSHSYLKMFSHWICR